MTSPTSSAPVSTVRRQRNLQTVLRGLAGAVLGAAIGYAVFRWMAQNRLYSILLPGACVGLGAGLLAGGKSHVLGAFCAVLAAIVMVVSEWLAFPFVVDKSFGFFVSHLHELPLLKLGMMALGVLMAYWFGMGRERY